ncbi:MAG: HEAT repeat domain-containing protein [Desulfuromonadales bacterium]|uniref:HEAT repeat domain-containing protein n=1 Tax=Desulfuromonas sp. KJ2020 TaxID=2919173 RepID=UPI0020A8272F|nr:HEAT repeat domain-containing protein [Desulfuromonas sp. KJ2020]MCP3176773.1 HEAT repeat domain-containing protein [Desulfuromonas sp. KJ2020]
MDIPQSKPILLENALRSLARIIKAASFYPPGHPALRAQVLEGLKAWRPLLAEGNLTFSVRKDHFLVDEARVGKDAAFLPQLATAFFARRVQRVLVMPDFSDRDLLGVARALAIRPELVAQKGGIEELLLQARVTTLWFNELQLDRIIRRKEEAEKAFAVDSGKAGDANQWDEPLLEEAAKQAEEKPKELQELEELLRNLQQQDISDDRYRLLLQEFPTKLRRVLNDEGRFLAIEALALLLTHAQSERLSAARRQAAHQALDALGMDDVLNYLVDLLCMPLTTRQEQDAIITILLFYGTRVVTRIMDRLCSEKGGQARRCLTELLSRQGAEAIPILNSYLKDERWYVKRNVVFILGEIRHPAAVPALIPLLKHEDVRVGREAIRALSRIGGPEALDILLQVAEDEDPDLRRLAFLSLGAMKEPAAVPFLLKVVQSKDFLVKKLDEKKEAIRALGEIAAPGSWPHLLEVLHRKKFWKRSRYNDLRAAAAGALASFPVPEVLEALEAATEDPAQQVARAAVLSLKQLKKG